MTEDVAEVMVRRIRDGSKPESCYIQAVTIHGDIEHIELQPPLWIGSFEGELFIHDDSGTSVHFNPEGELSAIFDVHRMIGELLKQKAENEQTGNNTTDV